MIGKGKLPSLADKINAKAEEELKNPQKVEEKTPVKVEKKKLKLKAKS
jgi:hypothetical protein